MPEALYWLNIEEAASAVVQKAVTALELTEVALDRLSTIGSALRCVATIEKEPARQTAAAADRELREGRRRGPLHGVPLAHKDMFYRAGRVSACGSRIRAQFVPRHTATVLSRLDAAGALDVARLNMVESRTARRATTR